MPRLDWTQERLLFALSVCVSGNSAEATTNARRIREGRNLQAPKQGDWGGRNGVGEWGREGEGVRGWKARGEGGRRERVRREGEGEGEGEGKSRTGGSIFSSFDLP